jgi:hypothetical protein
MRESASVKMAAHQECLKAMRSGPINSAAAIRSACVNALLTGLEVRQHACKLAAKAAHACTYSRLQVQDVPVRFVCKIWDGLTKMVCPQTHGRHLDSTAC